MTIGRERETTCSWLHVSRAPLVNHSVARESPGGHPIPSGAMSFAPTPRVAAASRAAPAARAAGRVLRVAARALPPSRSCPARTLSCWVSSASASPSATRRAARRGVRAFGDARDERAVSAEDVRSGDEDSAVRSSASSELGASADAQTTEKENRFPTHVSGVAAWWASYSRRVSNLAAQVKDLGMAGMTAYGILNTAYYTLAFTTAWYFRVIPANLGAAAAFRVAGEVMALVWAGSQVTKLARLGLAVAGAPKIDEGIKSVCAKTGWAYRNVFVCVVFGCFLGSAAFFSLLILAKAALA